jgi:hypothetical protein
MSASASWLTNIFGGGLSIKDSHGAGFSTIYDPATGSYKTNISTGSGGTTIVAAGAGQTPVSTWASLTNTTSGNWLIFGVVGIVLILVVGHLGKRL